MLAKTLLLVASAAVAVAATVKSEPVRIVPDWYRLAAVGAGGQIINEDKPLSIDQWTETTFKTFKIDQPSGGLYQFKLLDSGIPFGYLPVVVEKTEAGQAVTTAGSGYAVAWKLSKVNAKANKPNGLPCFQVNVVGKSLAWSTANSTSSADLIKLAPANATDPHQQFCLEKPSRCQCY